VIVNEIESLEAELRSDSGIEKVYYVGQERRRIIESPEDESLVRAESREISK
jgi:hypothetical protein